MRLQSLGVELFGKGQVAQLRGQIPSDARILVTYCVGCVVRSGLLEVPVTTVRLGQRNLPSSGGGWFRLFPYALSRWMIRRVNEQDQAAAIFYMHPWEIDHGQPRVPGINLKTRFRHYVNIARTEQRLDALLQDFRWGRMDEIFLAPAAAARSAP